MTGATPGQAAFETHELASSYQWGSGAHPWDHGNPTSQLIWELAFRAGVDAANGTYTRPEFRLDHCPLHAGRKEVQIRRNGEWMCLQAAVAAPAPTPAPEREHIVIRDFLTGREMSHEETEHGPQPAPELAEARPRVDWARVSEAVADRERERDEARAELDRLRLRLAYAAAALDSDALATAPSKKSQIQEDAARRVREAIG